MEHKNIFNGYDHWMRLILRYLIDNPEAKDTFEGICKWWFTLIPDEQDAQNIQQALTYLVEQNLIFVRRISLGQEIYGINKDNLQEVHRVLDTFNSS